MNLFDTDELFDGVGVKLQAVAKWFYLICFGIVLLGGFVGVIAALLCGSLLVALLCIVGIALAAGLYILGVVISSWYIHGFGILVEKAERDLEKDVVLPSQRPAAPVSTRDPSTVWPPVAAPGTWRCACGMVHPLHETTCACGARKSSDGSITKNVICPRCHGVIRVANEAKSGVCLDCGITFAVE